MDDISRMQEIQFDLMKVASFNDFNGEQVVKDLLANRELWQGALMKTYGITLRDLPDNDFNVDTLMISVRRSKVAEFLKLTEGWVVDECDEIGHGMENWDNRDYWLGSSSDEKEFAVYRLWWD